MAKVKKFFSELKRRKVYRVAIAYAVVAWLLIQIATQTFPFFDIPVWTIRLVIVLLVLGFPVALVFAWAYDLTPAGIRRTDDIEPSSGPSSPVKVSVPEKSIAVLPFENLSDDPENAYFADGIQDDILSSLSKIADLKVISRTSVRQYKTGDRNLREIGESLGVAHILEGTVRRAGKRVRVVTQLINARTDTHIWAETFDRELTDLFALQSELAERITRQLRASISPVEMANLQRHPTADLKAYENFLQARDLFRWSGGGDPRENGEKALRLLDEAIDRDPKFALAHSLASRWHAELYWFGHDKSRARLTRAKTEADTALRLQPDLGDAHLAMAYYHYFGFHDYDRAREELELACCATPNDSEVFDARGAVSRRQGQWDVAVDNFEKAWQLDPRNPSVIWNLTETYTALRRYGEAERAIESGLALNPQAQFFPLARATINLRRDGDVEPLCEALRNTPHDFEPGGSVTLLAIRACLIRRDYEGAAERLAASTHSNFNDTGLGGFAGMIDGYSFPKAWYHGLVARALGETEKARTAFEVTYHEVYADLMHWTDHPKASAMLGLVEAARGNKSEALQYAQRAVELLPVSRDAFDGPILETNLAVVETQVGDIDAAIARLTKLVSLPNGPTPATLRVEPEWDPLRGDPRFQKLIG